MMKPNIERTACFRWCIQLKNQLDKILWELRTKKSFRDHSFSWTVIRQCIFRKAKLCFKQQYIRGESHQLCRLDFILLPQDESTKLKARRKATMCKSQRHHTVKSYRLPKLRHVCAVSNMRAHSEWLF